jgi:hypothetical protein
MRIDNDSQPGRIFCEHLQAPRFRAELLGPDDLPNQGLTLPAPQGNWLLILGQIGDGVIEEQDLYLSLEAALKEHQAANRAALSAHHFFFFLPRRSQSFDLLSVLCGPARLRGKS